MPDSTCQKCVETGSVNLAMQAWIYIFLDSEMMVSGQPTAAERVIFSSYQLQQQYYQNPGLVQELGSLMMHGLSKQQG